MTKGGAVIAGIGIIVALIGWRLSVPSTQSSSQSVVKSSVIRIAVSQTPLSSPFFIAESKRLFKQQGLNVELVPCIGGNKCMSLLLDRKVDFATASETVFMFNSFEYPSLRLITSFVESDNDLKLLTLTDTAVADLASLAGKKVGVVKASASEFFLDSLLILNGVDSSKVERIYFKPSQLVEALLTTKVDAIAAWEPYGYELNSTVPTQVLQLPSRGVYNLSFNLIGFELSARQQQAIPALLTALEQANLYLTAHPKQSQMMISEGLDISFRQLNWSWQDYLFRLSLGNALLSNLQTQARWAINRQLVPAQKMPLFRPMFWLEGESSLHLSSLEAQ